MKTKIFSMCIILAAGIVACQKSDVESVTQDGTSSLKSTEITVNDVHQEGIACESQYEADFLANSEIILRNLGNGYGRLGKYLDLKGGVRYQIGHCPDVTIDTADAGYPITITLNYGESTVLKNGRNLSGLIEIVISGPKHTDGTTKTFTYNDFTVDSVVINGSISQLFSGDDSSSRTSTITDDLTFAYPDTITYTRVGNRVVNWLEGIDTPLDPEDDKIEITGNVTITSSVGDSYTRSIIEPLIRLGSCKYIVQGISQITLNSEVISEINYGDGNCDNQATITVAGVDSTITLNNKMPKHSKESKRSNSGQNKKGKGK